MQVPIVLSLRNRNKNGDAEGNAHLQTSALLFTIHKLQALQYQQYICDENPQKHSAYLATTINLVKIYTAFSIRSSQRENYSGPVCRGCYVQVPKEKGTRAIVRQDDKNI